jgi:di/tricarboxylate transporter
MTGEIALLLLIIVATMVLLALEIVDEDVVALGVIVTLIVTGLLTTEQAFAGFGSDTFMLLFGLFILTTALARTGVVERAGRYVLRYSGENPNRLLAIIMGAVSGLGAFLSNTAATAFFLPLVMGVARKTKTSPSKLLMPVAFASILTSSVTLISTSTNIVVSEIITRHGLQPMGMFELAPVGIPIAIVGLLYMYFIGRRIIPDRIGSQTTLDQLTSAQYATEVVVMPDSVLAGKTLAESNFGKEFDLNVVRIVRNKSRYIAPKATTKLEVDDVLLVEGERDALLKVKDIDGLEFKADVKFGDLEKEAPPEAPAGEETPEAPETNIVELMIVPGSRLIGRTLRGSQFRERYGVNVLAVNRHGENVRRKISEVTLKMGDILLIQGKNDDLAELQLEENNFRILGAVNVQRTNWKRAPIAIGTFLAAFFAATFGIISFPVAVLAGTIVVFVTRCLTPEEAYREVEWKALILIGSMLAIGVAMNTTGAAEWIADLIVGWVGESDPFWILTGFFILTVVLTQPMSNQAAAVVVIPVALATATQLGLNPRTFAMTIALAASCSYLTPLEPSCLMVYGPGGYRFIDFFRVGGLLTIAIYAITIVLAPMVWPLTAG